MKSYIEKELFLLSFRHACVTIYFLVIPFLIPFFYRPSFLFITLIALFITHNLTESIIWFYKSRKIRKHQSGDLSKRGHVLTRIVQRLEQLMMISFVVFFINEWIQGIADLSNLFFITFFFIIVFLQHIQLYYVQVFFKSKSRFSYVPSWKRARPSYIARERKALNRS